MNPNPKNVTFAKRRMIPVVIFAAVSLLLLTVIRANTEGRVAFEPTANTSDETAYGGEFYQFLEKSDPPDPPDPPNPPGDGKYTAEQIAYSTGLQASGPFNTHPEAGGLPFGLHDDPISLPEGWGFTKGALARGDYQTFFRPTIEWRGAVFAKFGTIPKGDVIIQMRNPAYYAFANGQWTKQWDVDLDRGAGCCGSFLSGNPVGGDVFTGGNHHGAIAWKEIGTNTYEAPWAGPQAMHFWRGGRHPVQPGQTAELAVGEMRMLSLDRGAPDTANNQLLAQIGVDYYNEGENNTKAPGPGIGRYQYLDDEWVKIAWVTTPKGTPITYDATVNWLKENPPPVLVP